MEKKITLCIGFVNAKKKKKQLFILPSLEIPVLPQHSGRVFNTDAKLFASTLNDEL